MKRVYVLLVNWNGWGDTIECLESVFRLDYPDYRVIVCDNGSTDGSLDRIVAWADGVSTPHKQFLQHDLTSPPVVKPLSYSIYDRQEAEKGGDYSLDPRLTLIRAGSNLGFAGGNNVGLRHILARGDFDFVWLLNNDTVVDQKALSALVARMAEKPLAGMCGSTLVHYENPERIQARGGGWYCKWIGLPWHIGQLGQSSAGVPVERVEKWMNYVVGASMLVSREMVANVGLMSEAYFLYYEELDWFMRATPDFTLAYAQESLVYHKIGSSIGTSTDPRKKSTTCEYYSIRNRIRFTRNHYPAALLTLYPVLFLAVLYRLILREWRLSLMALKLMLAGGRDVESIRPKD